MPRASRSAFAFAVISRSAAYISGDSNSSVPTHGMNMYRIPSASMNGRFSSTASDRLGADVRRNAAKVIFFQQFLHFCGRFAVKSGKFHAVIPGFGHEAQNLLRAALFRPLAQAVQLNSELHVFFSLDIYIKNYRNFPKVLTKRGKSHMIAEQGHSLCELTWLLCV